MNDNVYSHSTVGTKGTCLHFQKLTNNIFLILSKDDKTSITQPHSVIPPPPFIGKSKQEEKRRDEFLLFIYLLHLLNDPLVKY